MIPMKLTENHYINPEAIDHRENRDRNPFLGVYICPVSVHLV
jgi:hypothetical protein